jgi:predicted dehydrogenase
MRPGVVVVGTGWGCLMHVPALRAVGFDVAALVGTDATRTARRAAALEIPLSTTEVEQALSAPGVVAAVVATPPTTHRDIALRVIAAGKHVLCEKPFATTVADARAMWEAARSTGVVNRVGFEMRFLPHQAVVSDAVRRGLIGTPTLWTHVRFGGLLAGRDATVPDWFGRADEFGGWLNAEIQHLIDEARLAVGDITRVTASELQVTQHDWDAAETFAVHFEAAGGAVGSIQSSIGTFGPPDVLSRVAGTEGTLRTTADDVVTLITADGERVLEPPSYLLEGELLDVPQEVHGSSTLQKSLARATRFSRAAQHMHARFLASIRGEGADGAWPPAGTFDDGLRNTEVHEAILRSTASGTTEAVVRATEV